MAKKKKYEVVASLVAVTTALTFTVANQPTSVRKVIIAIIQALYVAGVGYYLVVD
jgi:hypothetical protein